MTHKEIIYQAISEVCNTDNPQRFTEMNKTIFQVAERVLELSKPSLPSNLDEAAKDYQERIYDGEYSGHIKRYQDTFKAGAEWMNMQMKIPNSTKLISEWNNVKTILEEKDFRGDKWRLAYNAFMIGFSRGINTQKTEK